MGATICGPWHITGDHCHPEGVLATDLSSGDVLWLHCATDGCEMPVLHTTRSLHSDSGSSSHTLQKHLRDTCQCTHPESRRGNPKESEMATVAEQEMARAQE